jgi:hypothetical protein
MVVVVIGSVVGGTGIDGTVVGGSVVGGSVVGGSVVGRDVDTLIGEVEGDPGASVGGEDPDGDDPELDVDGVDAPSMVSFAYATRNTFVRPAFQTSSPTFTTRSR